VIARFKRPDAADLLLPPDGSEAYKQAAEEAQKVRHRLDEAADAYANDRLTMAQLTTINDRLRPRLAELETAATPPPDRAALLGDLVSAEDVEAMWFAFTPERRREVVRYLMDIKIHRTRKGNTFTTDGIEIIWK